MKKSVRQGEIFRLVKQHQTCSIAELAEQLHVSGETIRRNVRSLVADGLVLKVHGGITLPFMEYEPPLPRRMTRQVEEKKIIANRVAQQVENGDSLIIDSGSTTSFVAQALQNHHNLTVATNSSYIANLLAMTNNNRVLMAGGELSAHDAAAYGPSAIDFVRGFEAHKAILSIAAIHPTRGCMDQHLNEAEISRAIIEQAEQVIVATDSSKFGRVSPMKICDLDKITILVCDKKPGKALQSSLDKAQVQVISE